MNPAPAPSSSTASLLPARSALLAAWPRSAQLALTFLLGMTTALLGIHLAGMLRWGSKPSAVEPKVLLAYRIDLNRANRAELLQIPGVGEDLAERMENYRLQHGPFHSTDDLNQISGIGQSRLKKIEPWIRVGPEDHSVSLPSAPARKTLATNTSSKKVSGLKGQIDINRATPEEMQHLPGIGPKMAAKIVEERNRKEFQSVDDLRRVVGIGPKKLEAIRPFVTVDSQPRSVARTVMIPGDSRDPAINKEPNKDDGSQVRNQQYIPTGRGPTPGD